MMGKSKKKLASQGSQVDCTSIDESKHGLHEYKSKNEDQSSPKIKIPEQNSLLDSKNTNVLGSSQSTRNLVMTEGITNSLEAP